MALKMYKIKEKAKKEKALSPARQMRAIKCVSKLIASGMIFQVSQ